MMSQDAMTPLVPIALLGWAPLVVAMFLALKPRVAVAAAFLIGFLFLPVAIFDVPGVPEYSKVSATSVGVLLGVIVFDAGRLLRLRPSLIDLPILAWCVAPMFSSITNGLGAYDGFASVVDQVLSWGVPYLMGRLYFSDGDGLAFLCKVIVIGGLLYVPLCLFEVRMSPQLHRMLYGYHAHSFHQTTRFGGYRPTVFMQHGLMVGMWMTAASLAAVWMAMSKRPARLFNVPLWAVAAAIIGAAVLCKSLGALFLLAVGLAVLVFIRATDRRLPLTAMALAIPLFLGARIALDWQGEELVDAAAAVSPERAESLQVRLENENLLLDKAMRRPLFGWGGWNRARLDDTETITDSLWIIAVGQKGLFGLAACFAVLVVPVFAVATLSSRKLGAAPFAHAVLPLALIVGLYAADSLLNAMINPIFAVAAGGLCGFVVVARPVAARRRSPARSQAQFVVAR